MLLHELNPGENCDSETRSLWKAVNSSIPSIHAGGKYGLGNNCPVSYKRAGFFITNDEVTKGFMLIHINIVAGENAGFPGLLWGKWNFGILNMLKNM
jgi:hypothetical protein